MVQHKKKISDQASACTKREDGEQKYRKKSVADGLVCNLSVQSSRQERYVEAFDTASRDLSQTGGHVILLVAIPVTTAKARRMVQS